jgi:hypothetical protein
MGFPTYDKPSLADLMAQAPDLDAVKHALIREDGIRHVMSETGESREIVAEMVDSIDSMDQEAVLELTDGEPTTLAQGLATYIGELNFRLVNSSISRNDTIIRELSALLLYPWPGVKSVDLRVEQGDEEIDIWVGDHLAASSDHGEIGHAGMRVLGEAATAIHEAIVSRLTVP